MTTEHQITVRLETGRRVRVPRAFRYHVLVAGRLAHSTDSLRSAEAFNRKHVDTNVIDIFTRGEI